MTRAKTCTLPSNFTAVPVYFEVEAWDEQLECDSMDDLTAYAKDHEDVESFLILTQVGTITIEKSPKLAFEAD